MTPNRGISASLLALLLAMSFPVESTAGLIFSDDFSDGDTVGWTFHGTNSDDWSVVGGRLEHNPSSGYNGKNEFALIDGITTPNQFLLEADVSVISSSLGGDNGHVGLGWGVTDLVDPFQSFNMSYLSTGSDDVRNWSMLNGATPGFLYLDCPGVTIGTTYPFSVHVDYPLRSMIVTLGPYSTMFTETDFDNMNQNIGGGIGLVSWNSRITFDNVRLSAPAPIPEPSTLVVLGLGVAGLAARGLRRRKQMGK